MASIRVSDPVDKDMSGASIFAVKPGTGTDGPPVDIAVAWGQDPSVSRPRQELSMDMGTVTLPFTNVKVAKLVNKVFVNAGDELTYTIRVANVGQKHVYANELTVIDSLDAEVTYVPGSTQVKYMYDTFAVVAMADSPTGTPFPLDGDGYTIPTQIPRRGKYLDITFKVKIASTLSENKSKIVNVGAVQQKDGVDLPFEATSFVHFKSSVKVDNTVLLGLDGSKCASGVEVVSSRFMSNVTYCFTVTNTGLSHLTNIQLSNVIVGNFTKGLNKTLAPGQSATIFTSGLMTYEGTNEVIVNAQPAFPNGAEISDAAAVVAADTSGIKLIPFSPNILVDNKVYIGNDGKGTKCNTSAALETVYDIYNTAVTYCFIVKNTGDTWLNTLTIENGALRYQSLLSGVMAPNESKMIFVPGTIALDLTNRVKVTGLPILKDGLRIVGASTVTSEDPSAVVKLSFKPSIRVDNTVYLGKDGGKACGSSAAVEYVAGYFDSAVTYCFKITNTGETALKDIVIGNAALQYSTTAATLASGASVMLYLEKKIANSLKNIANVTGTPVMADGRALSDLRKVSHSDPSEIGLKDHRPSVSIENTVVLGHEGGCGTAAAKESVQGYPGSKITYCFNVKNTGESFLDSITLTNEKLAYTSTVPKLAPGVSTMVTLQRTITGSFENLAKVTGNPTLESGVDIPGQADVSATDVSSVVLLDYKPSVSVQNTVYRGSSESKACSTSIESVEGKFGDDVAYCFLVKNTGNTHLKNIKLDNVELVFKDITSIKVLAPGESSLVMVGGKITKSIENVVVATATPTKENGESLATPDVKSTDPSSVVRIAHTPSIKIDNKVYIGSVDDKLCSTDKAMEIVRDIYMTQVVYCLTVTNNGETHLGSIVIEDEELEYSPKLNFTLAPGASELIVVPGKISADLKNIAMVKANPILSDGRDIEGIPDVSSSDDSAVNKLVFVPSVKVENTVYKGANGGDACHTSSESVKDLFGTNVTYCFKVTNTGATSLKDVILSNEVLLYTTVLDSPLKPGDSRLFTFPSRISTAIMNNMTVIATPVMSDGRDLLDLQKVEHSDPSGVELLPHSPSLTITNTVYLGGSDNGAKCSTGVEAVEDKYGATVTYCFTVKNTGDTYLQAVTLFDTEIALPLTPLGVLGPDESTTFSFVGAIQGDLTNIAVASGSPSLQDGADIPDIPDVVAKDPSSVKVVAFQPSINIENTVYIGTDAGATCTDSKLEVVSGYPKTEVVYCLQVSNTGDSYLSNVLVVDAELKINDSSIKLLAPGESKIISVSGIISGNVTNTATVTALPALADGKVIPTASSVSDSDPSGVAQLAYSPAVKIDNVIGLGRDSCANARDLVDGFMGDDITYCFVVTNNGDTVLTKVSIVDNAIGYSVVQPDALAPGDSITIPYPSTITGDLINVAVVTATPSNKDLSPIDGLNNVVSEDPSQTNKFDLVGGIKIVNTVYDSSVADSSCATSVESIEGTYGTPTTYCFKVSNTGETYLNNVVVTNPDLVYTSNSIKTLAPGESIVLSVPSKITSTIKNTAVATGNPVTATGKDILDLKDVTSKDSSDVVMLESKAAITIANTVYSGVDDGKLCGTSAAVEKVQGFYGAPVTYCFEVTNNGATSLTQVSLVNKELEIIDNTIKNLSPGETVIIPVKGKVTSSLINNAVVTAGASLADGTIIPGMGPVTASDKSEVERLQYIASVDIINTVYLGGSTNNNGLSSCGTTAAVDHVEHYDGAVVTYCFEVMNKGDSFLDDVVIVNKDLAFEEKLAKPLAPGESITVAYPSTITSSLKNTAVVTANPVTKEGSDIPDMKEVTWSDSSSVGELVYFPSISIDNRVYIGDDNGAACETAVESVSGKANTSVIYCFNVTNTGDTYLSNIEFSDIELMYKDNSIAIMAPKTSKLLVFISKITANLTNHAVVVANPTLADGADISGAMDVSATDPSDVVLKRGIDSDVKQGEKTPYEAPPTNSTKCIQDNWKAANHTDDLVCASKEVYIDSVAADVPKTCTLGETITITVDANIQISGPRNDVGWYIASDGGDALTGQCIVNGFQNSGAAYNVLNSNGQSAGFVKFTKADGADGDQCGDIFIVNDGSAKVAVPVMVNAKLPCTDDNDDGALDFAICFSWKTDATNGMCNFSTNIPGTNCGCYCTRIDVPNVEVIPTPVDPIAAC